MEHPVSVRWGLVGTSGFADTIFAPTLKQAGQTLVGAAGSTPEHSDSFADGMAAHAVYGTRGGSPGRSGH